MSNTAVEDLDGLFEQAGHQIEEARDEQELEEVRIRFLGRKGELTAFLRNLANLSPEERPFLGKRANEIKEEIQEAFQRQFEKFKRTNLSRQLENEKLDFSLPGRAIPSGALHPVTLVLREAKEIFRGMGFQVIQGPEIETDYYNFEALNIPPEHPSREMWDSFYLEEKILLRTHTSPVQIRVLEKIPPPLRVISAGKCYRRDSVDATHSFQFYQMEGFLVDEGIGFSHLKGVLSEFVRAVFGGDRKVNFVPSYFPFTEPSVEVLMDCFKCAETGGEKQESCRICGGGKWVEILGAGMIHPFVLRRVSCSSRYTGFAFGLGIERIAMLKYGIDDIRLFYESQLRFLRQF